MMHVPADDRSAESGVGAANVAAHWRLRVDVSERNAALLDLARGCGDFEICMERLAVGDYLIDDGIVIERKTYSDFATSLGLQADFNHMDAGGRLRLGDLRMHQHTPFAEIAAKDETVIFVDGDDMVRGELVHDPEYGWIAQVDWSTQDVWESYPPAVAARG